MTTRTVYELGKHSIWTGRSRVLAPNEGRPRQWTAIAPPEVPAGQMAQLRGRVWVLIDSLPLSDVQRYAQEKRPLVDQWRDAAFAAGMPWQFDDDDDLVQTRPQDQVNLLGLRMQAEAALAAGGTDPVLLFRGQANRQRHLTPAEMIELTNAALAHIEWIYRRSWQLKDALDAATAIAEVDAVEWTDG